MGRCFLAWVREGLVAHTTKGRLGYHGQSGHAQVQGVREAIEAAGARLLYLPPIRLISTPLKTCGARSSKSSAAWLRAPRLICWRRPNFAFNAITPADLPRVLFTRPLRYIIYGNALMSTSDVTWPAISVVVPVYNSELTLSELVKRLHRP